MAQATAAVIESPRRTRLTETTIPEPGAGEVRLRLEGCGICGSDLPVWQGRDWFSYPRPAGSPGHEAWGLVDAVGPGVTGFSPGERVAALAYNGYAEFDVALASALVKLPPELDGQPFPGEPLACAINAFARCGISAGDNVAVVGVGFMGALLIQLATRAGARVMAISRRPFAREIATRMGALEVSSIDEDVVARAEEATGGELYDVVIEAAGTQSTLDLAGELTRVRGRLVIAGYHQDGLRQVNLQMWNWRGLDVINAHERDPAIYHRGLQQAVSAVARGALDPSPLFTHRYGLGELDAAFTAVESRPDGFLKALVTL